MTAMLGKAGKKLFEMHLEKYTPADPLYEEVVDKKGKKKRRKRALPPGLSARDAAILRSVKTRAHYLDKGFHLCGLRFGWTFIIGLIPILGDVADASLNYLLVVHQARKADLPDWLVRRMLLNNAVSAGIGFVPIVGDLIFAVYKANSRNATLLEEFLRIRGDEFIKMGGVAEEQAKKGGLFKRRTAKAKGKDKEGIAFSAADVGQVKPGAGMTGDEMKKVIDDPETNTSSIPPSDTKPSDSSASSGFGFLGSWSKKQRLPPPAASNNKGRFVENFVDADTK